MIRRKNGFLKVDKRNGKLALVSLYVSFPIMISFQKTFIRID